MRTLKPLTGIVNDYRNVMNPVYFKNNSLKKQWAEMIDKVKLRFNTIEGRLLFCTISNSSIEEIERITGFEFEYEQTYSFEQIKPLYESNKWTFDKEWKWDNQEEIHRYIAFVFLEFCYNNKLGVACI